MGISPSKLLRRPSTTVTLADELIVEVISFLDVKSLMRFKCVSKSWNLLISDPFFVKKHLLKSSRKPYLTLLSSSYSKIALLNPFPISRLFENSSVNLVDHNPNCQLIDCRDQHDIIGSCNGLICFHGSVQDTAEIYLYLWNPAMRTFSEKSMPFWYFDSDSLSEFSFGYDSLTDKYKVVDFHHSRVRVFTFGDNVWKNIQSFPTHPYICTYNCVNCGVYLNNSLNWLSLLNGVCSSFYYWKDISIDQFVIISLDLGMETYTQIPFPWGFDEVPPAAPIVCVLMDSLCFSHYSRENNFIIWQMKKFGFQESWTKLLKFNYVSIFGSLLPSFNFQVDHLWPLHLSEDGDTLILANTDGQLIHYNMIDNRIADKSLITNYTDWFFVDNYVESLVSTCWK